MVLSLLVDKRKKTSVKMDLILPNGGDFFMVKKGQTFWSYSLELKLRQPGWSMKKFSSMQEEMAYLRAEIEYSRL